MPEKRNSLGEDMQQRATGWTGTLVSAVDVASVHEADALSVELYTVGAPS